MGQIQLPSKAFLIMAILARDDEGLEKAKNALFPQFGAPDQELGPLPFEYTQYYAKEVGDHPRRMLLLYARPVSRRALIDAKLITQKLEAETADPDGKRSINLDPGLVTAGQLFLASTKDGRQRVYVDDGIFVEPTLYVEGKVWQPFPWTYPDWKSGHYEPLLTAARLGLIQALREERIKTDLI